MNRSQTNKELANVLSHLFGLILALVFSPVLMFLAYSTANPSWIIACGIYACSLIMILTSSVIFHSAYEPYLRHKLRIVDHICIYIIIAGTYTPIIMMFFPNLKGYILLGLVWLCVVLGILFKIFYVHKYKIASTIAYIIMGVLFLALGGDLNSLPSSTLVWLIIGGVLFLIGTLFYVKDELFYNHFIWHLFVLGGLICHFIAISYGLIALSH